VREEIFLEKNRLEQTAEALQLIDPILWAITSKDENSRGGLIATFVTNASIVKQCPRFLIGIARQHHTCSLIEKSKSCALHLIGKEQMNWVWELGTRTGSQIDKLANFEQTQWTTGAPILSQSIAAFDCEVEAQWETGDRTVYLLAVIQGRKFCEAEPLKFSDLWNCADDEQKERLNRQLDTDRQIDYSAIEQWRSQGGTPVLNVPEGLSEKQASESESFPGDESEDCSPYFFLKGR